MSDKPPVPTSAGSANPPGKSDERKREEALYELFDQFALGDQRSYYASAIVKANTSASQINALRAFFSLLTGVSAALAGLIVQFSLKDPATCAATPLLCNYSQPIVVILLILAVVAPAIGGVFGTLADLFQWDRLETIYRSALETLEVADALSPDSEMSDQGYLTSLREYTESTLGVMRDEASQWGQLIRDPSQLTAFIASAQAQAQQIVRDPVGSIVNPPIAGTNITVDTPPVIAPVTPVGLTATPPNTPALSGEETPLSAPTRPIPLRDVGITPGAPLPAIPTEGGTLPPGTPNLDPSADG